MTALANISNELHIQRYENGVKLIRPDPRANQHTTGDSLASMLNLPLNIYAYDLNNTFQFSNDHNSQLCGFFSNEDAINKHINEIAVPEIANQLAENNGLVARSKSLKIIDEDFTRHDGFEAGATTLKFPWYNGNDDIIGIFGFSIQWNCESEPKFSSSLSLLMNLGLLNSSTTKSDSVYPGVMIENSYFSKRECDVLYHMIRGRSAREIAKVLGISYRTVETHISNAKNRIGVHTKSQLIERVYHLFQ